METVAETPNLSLKTFEDFISNSTASQIDFVLNIVELLQSGKENVEGLSQQLMVPEKKDNELYIFFKSICKDHAFGEKRVFKGQKKNRKYVKDQLSFLIWAVERTLAENNIISE